MTYTTNLYNEVTSSPGTVDAIVEDLLSEGQVLIGWNDGHGSLIDVHMAFDPMRVGIPGKLDAEPRKLVVSAMGHGAFAFGPGGFLEPGYFAQKMGVQLNPTWKELAALVTEVRTKLTEAHLTRPR